MCYQNELNAGPKITVHIQRAFHLSPQPTEVLIPMLLVKLCPNGIKFRAQTTKQSTLDPVFDKKFSFSVSQNSYEKSPINDSLVERKIQRDSNWFVEFVSKWNWYSYRIYQDYEKWTQQARWIPFQYFLIDSVGYIDIGNGCWRRNELVTTLKCWWQFWSFLSPTSSIFEHYKRIGINIQKLSPISKLCH